MRLSVKHQNKKLYVWTHFLGAEIEKNQDNLENEIVLIERYKYINKHIFQNKKKPNKQ